jgi:hypothetical protein
MVPGRFPNRSNEMQFRKLIAGFAAVALALTTAGSALAVDDSESVNFNLVVTANAQLSVDITASSNFTPVPFTLAGPANWTESAYYNMRVIDMRGTGVGWNVVAYATPFVPNIPGAALQHGNNTLWSGLCTPAATFCAAAGSISNGVAHYTGSPNVMGNSTTIMWSAAGQTAAPSPYGTGTFTMQNVVYYNNIPDALTVGNYATTLTLSLTGTAP